MHTSFPPKKTKMDGFVLLLGGVANVFAMRNAGRATLVAAAIAAALLMTGCHKKAKPRVAAAPRATIAPRIGATETGIASWYGYPYHGRRAANGEIYDMEKMTAAHRTLPFDTWVEVRNLSNEKAVKVRITDRGPFIDGRIVDLSKAAARAIELLGPGIAQVLLTVVAAPAPEELPVANVFSVQIGAFRERERAEALRADYEREYGFARVVFRAGATPMWRVLVGRAETLDAASGLVERIKQKTSGAVFVVRLDEVPMAEGAGR